MPKALNITDLTDSLGEYFRKSPAVLTKGLTATMKSVEHFVLQQVKDELPLVNLGSTSILQPSLRDGSWSPIDDALEFPVRILKARPVKVDLEIVPESLFNTFLGYAASAGSSDPGSKLPLEAYIFDEVIRRVKDDLELKAIFKGDYDAAGTTPAATMDGLLKLIADSITATEITPTTTGAITASNAVAKVELIVDAAIAANPAITSVPAKCYVSPKIFNFYNQNYRATYGALPYNKEFQKTFLELSPNVELVSMPGMGTSSRIILTTADNIHLGMDLMGDMTNIVVEKEKRVINMMIDFVAGIQFARPELMFVNEQA
jgi:hypothetical protein